MGTRLRTASLAAASALLVATFAPLTFAGTASGDAGIWQDSKGRPTAGPRGGHDRGRAPRGPRGEKNPIDETPVAPVPEPGTMALVSLGLMSLAAGLRKRRANHAPASGTTS